MRTKLEAWVIVGSRAPAGAKKIHMPGPARPGKKAARPAPGRAPEIYAFSLNFSFFFKMSHFGKKFTNEGKS